MKSSNLRKLTNSYSDFEMFNLSWNPGGKGPYLIRQIGYVPGDHSMEVLPFILQRDGTWLLSYHFACLPEGEQEKRLFPSIKEMIKVVDRIASKDVRFIDSLPEGVSNAEALRRYKASTARALQRMRQAKAEPVRNS